MKTPPPADKEKKRLIVAIGGTAACMAGAVFSHFAGPLTLHELVRDMAYTASVHPLLGAISVFGAWLMIASAAVAGFGLCLGPRPTSDRAHRRLLLGLGLISLLLGFDDQFMFHETLARWYLGLGETTVLALIATTIIGVLLIGRSALFVGGRWSLPLAIGFGVLSLIVDNVFAKFGSAWRIGLEDGFKLAAMACWLVYVSRIAAAYIKTPPALAAPSDTSKDG